VFVDVGNLARAQANVVRHIHVVKVAFNAELQESLDAGVK
jgi:hypothetical protein